MVGFSRLSHLQIRLKRKLCYLLSSWGLDESAGKYRGTYKHTRVEFSLRKWVSISEMQFIYLRGNMEKFDGSALSTKTVLEKQESYDYSTLFGSTAGSI